MRIDDTPQSADVGATRCPVTGIGQAFNPFDPHYLADPYVFWAKARQDEPVFYSPELDYWVITRYEDIKGVFADPRTYSAGNAQTPIAPLASEVTQFLQTGGLKSKPTMSNADPPDHTRIRKFTWQAFTPKRVAELEPAIRRIVTAFIDRIEGQPTIDLVRQMFYDLPVHVLFIFLGMREEDVHRVKAWSHKRLMLTWGRLTPQQQMIEAQGLLDYWKYTEGFVEGLLHGPPDNYVGDLLRVHLANPDDLSLNEVVNVIYGLLVAGHETTTSMSANAIRTLLLRRENWESLCAEPDLIPDAVEELLRYDSSVITWRRRTTREVMLGDVRLPAGANLLLALCSGNHDAAHFPQPERIDFRRDNLRSHLSFGFGIHYCLGAPLARLELKVILEELTRRKPEMRLAQSQSYEYSPNTSFRGPAQLLVNW